MTCASSFQKLSDQLKADKRPEFGDFGLRTKWSYSVKGEPNHIFRWSMTVILVIAYLVRVMYFEADYTLLSSILFFFFFLFALLRIYRAAIPDPYLLSYGECFEDPLTGKYDSALFIYFSHELSPPEFDAFAQRLFEFQFWYTATKAVIIALFLTWFTIVRFPSIGPVIVLLLWGGVFVTLNIISLVRLMDTKFRK